jgi:ectoine hydroxylase-related dioxygenase (phytanoyl-CoA dioxygenase family)
MHAITEQQVAYFETFGFLVLRQAFDVDEMAAFGARFDEMLTEDRGGIPFPGARRQSLYRLAELDPLFTAMVADDRIYKTVEALLGKDFIWLCSEGNKYVGDTDWHPDGTRLDCRPLKVSLYLDPLTAQTGSLRVIPGSHRLPYHEALKPCARFGLSDAEIPCLPLETRPGDVIFADMNTWHASVGGAVGRRHIAVNFAEEPKTDADVAMMVQNYDGVLRHGGQLQYSPLDRVFTDAFLQSDNPRIRRLVARWIDMDMK